MQLLDAQQTCADALLPVAVVAVEIDGRAAVAAGVHLSGIGDWVAEIVHDDGLLLAADGDDVAALTLRAELLAVVAHTVAVVQSVVGLSRKAVRAVPLAVVLPRLCNRGLDLAQRGGVALRYEQRHAVLGVPAALRLLGLENVAVGKTDLSGYDFSAHSF